MKKYICILAGAALLVACERKTETAAPNPTVSPEATAATSPEESATSTNASPAATP
jgi:PBP1b-binding outer membrane lipoprotein LpoB